MIRFFTKAPPSVAARAEALKEAQILMLASSEFHTTSLARFKESVRDPVASVPSQSRPYKAIVVMLLDGGADTHHMLMPHSGCIGDDLNAQYEEVRGAMSLSKTEVLTISAPNANPCSTYGINPDLPILQELYNDGDASFVL